MREGNVYCRTSEGEGELGLILRGLQAGNRGEGGPPSGPVSWRGGHALIRNSQRPVRGGISRARGAGLPRCQEPLLIHSLRIVWNTGTHTVAESLSPVLRWDLDE